jgi:hypothetical protein
VSVSEVVAVETHTMMSEAQAVMADAQQPATNGGGANRAGQHAGHEKLALLASFETPQPTRLPTNS